MPGHRVVLERERDAEHGPHTNAPESKENDSQEIGNGQSTPEPLQGGGAVTLGTAGSTGVLRDTERDARIHTVTPMSLSPLIDMQSIRLAGPAALQKARLRERDSSSARAGHCQ